MFAQSGISLSFYCSEKVNDTVNNFFNVMFTEIIVIVGYSKIEKVLLSKSNSKQY